MSLFEKGDIAHFKYTMSQIFLIPNIVVLFMQIVMTFRFLKDSYRIEEVGRLSKMISILANVPGILFAVILAIRCTR